MKAVLPGKPEPRLQALSTGVWDSRRVITYITGNGLAILGDYNTLHQTIYDDDKTRLEAVAFDEVSGNIATCTDRIVRIYQPIGRLEETLQWALRSSFAPDVYTNRDTAAANPHFPMTLSWGASQELVVAQHALALYNTGSRPSSPNSPIASADAFSPSCSWRKQLANPAKWATSAYDSAFIATAGYTDRLVKIWRRLSFDTDNARFDYAYLPHPQPVTGLQWRIPYHIGHTIDHVLYTFCADNILRIWTSTEMPGSAHQQLSLWGTVDLMAALNSDPSRQPILWAFVIQGRDLSAATEKAIQEQDEQNVKNDRALAHLVTIANRSSEICLILDARGTLSALSLENLGSRSPNTNDVYNITLLTSTSLDFARNMCLTSEPVDRFSNHVEIYTFCNTGSHLHILIHYMSGKIEVHEADIAYLLDDVASTRPRLWRKATWTGHSGPIRKMVRNFSGSAVVSRTDTGESMLWHHAYGSMDTLFPQTALSMDGPVHRICVLRKGRFVVFMCLDSITVWDCRRAVPVILGRSTYTVSGKPLCLLVLPREHVEDSFVAHIATITSEKHGIVWEIVLPRYTTETRVENSHPQNDKTAMDPPPSVSEFCRFELGGSDNLAYVLPVDPAGATQTISGFLDVFARDVAISYTKTGGVGFWTARVDRKGQRVEWLLTSSMETGVQEPALVSGSQRKKAALVNASRSTVTIWDIRGAQLEYDGSFASHDTVQDLDWTSTPDSQSILAVGFPHRVLLLSQLRFDYLNKGPAWAVVRQISTHEQTPYPIGDSTWLGDGDLVIGAGNQLLVHDRLYSVPSSLVASMRLPHAKERNMDMFDVVQRLNGPLPVFHPQFLIQCMLAGKTALLQRILLALHMMLKFWAPGDVVDDYLGMDLSDFYMSKTHPDGRLRPISFSARLDLTEDEKESFSEDVAAAISEKLTHVALPQLSGHEQIQLMDIVECAGLVEKQRRSMDENAARYMLFFRQHALRKGRTNEIHMSWREINWAFHSTSQDILVDFVARQHHGSLLWKDARESGLFMWLADNAAVKSQFELVARNEYAKSEMKNPVDCSLFYLALRKKTVLQGLWRMATWNREQGATQKLLGNNFDDPKWRTTALKNAYALMSKRRFEYAAAFFLLADRLQDAVAVIFNQLNDLQLAIVVARVYEGDHGPVLRKFLEEEVLTIAAQEGNRWLASWAFWMLHRRDMSVRALIAPVYTLVETPCSPDIKAKLFLTDDPALVILYAQLRQKTLQTLRGASKVTPKVEWELVLHSARLYGRMGCDLLGLDLVRNWEFLNTQPTEGQILGGDINPFKMLGRRSSLVVADLPVSPIADKLSGDSKMSGRTPTVFEEPDANSLLDSFGF